MRAGETGQALPLALLLVAVLLVAAALLAGVARSSLDRASANRTSGQLLDAARTGVAQARCATWDAAVAAGADADPARARAFLDELRLLPGEPRWLEGERLVAAPPSAGALRLQAAPGQPASERITVQVSVERREEGGETFLLYVAEARLGTGARRSAELILRLGRPPYAGLGFGLLARNASCIFCHTRVENARRFHRTDAGPYPRVRVATLEALSMRTNNDSLLAGTLYVRGHLLSKDGTELAAPPGGNGGLQGETLDGGDGTIVGRPMIDLVDGTPSRAPFQAFYKQYPTDPSQQFDGPVPGEFPPLVPDLDGDRVIGDAEWVARTGRSDGRINGGVVLTVPRGGSWTGSALPSAGNATELRSGTPATNAILVGTAANPIRVDGEVAIDGDLVISGPVKGTGALLVRGNIYVVGDVPYADGQSGGARTFGTAPDGVVNAVAYAAGGNIVVGAYAVDKRGAPISDDALTGFTGQQIGLFNRMEWAKTQPFWDPRTRLPTSVDTGVRNSGYEAGHVARYYVLDPGATPRMFLSGSAWDNRLSAWVGKEKGDPEAPIGGSGFLRSALDPDRAWLSRTTLGALIASTDGARPRGAYQLDGLFYTPNALLLMVRKESSGRGQVVVNGGIVVADAGVLVPGPASGVGLGLGVAGLQLNYDERTAGLLQLDQDRGPVQPSTLLRRER